MADESNQIPEVRCTYSRLVDPTSLLGRPDNPNEHDERQIEMMQKILKHQGWRDAIVVSKDSGFVVCGHGRLRAALEMELKEVPVDDQNFENEADEYAHMIADNRLASMAEFNYEKVGDILRELDGKEIDLDLTGFMDWEREPLLNAIWEPPEERDDRDVPQNNSITLTTDQREVFEQAAKIVREDQEGEVTDGRAVELICADFISGN